MTQTRSVVTELELAHRDLKTEVVEITSYGDTDRTTPLSQMSQVGAFTRAIHDALLDDRAHVAVHSMKDLPTLPVAGIRTAAVPERSDARDVLVARNSLTLASLPAGARVGTDAPRRIAQLTRLRDDLDIVAIRGNVDTRLSKVADGSYDAVVLAAAGLSRLGRLGEATQFLDFVPAPGQGALSLQCRSDDESTAALLEALDDAETARCVGAERAWLTATGGGCRTNAGAIAHIVGSRIDIDWFLDGRYGSASGPLDNAIGIATDAGIEARG